MLREYAYLDRERVEDFLSQLEGGVSDTTKQSKTSAGSGINGGVNVGIARLGANLKAPSISQEDLRRTTDVALIERLFDHLEEPELSRISDGEDMNWATLRQGALLELECTAVISGMTKLSEIIGDMQPVSQLMGQSLDGAEGITALLGDGIGVRYSIDNVTVAYSTLRRESLRTNWRDLEGDCSAFVRVRKVLKTGKRVGLKSIAGMKLEISKLEELLHKFDNAPAELGFQMVREDLIAIGPAAMATTVAIYR